MRTKLIAAALLLLATFQTLFAAEPLVSADWLATNLQKPNLRIVDLQPAAGYQQIHIKGAVHSSYGQWRQTDERGIPGMIPSIPKLEQMISELGVDNQTHVVLVAFGRSAGDLAAATRVYWTFKAVGHDEVSILDGGMAAFANDRANPLESEINRPKAKSFKASLRNDYLVSADEVSAAINSETALLDSRSIPEFEGRRGMPSRSGAMPGRSGTIPTSVNLPFNQLVIPGSATFHDQEKLRKIFSAHQVPLQGKLLSYCQSGHRASLTWFVSHELLGNKETRLYDGSMAEWAANPSLPLK